MATLYDLAMRYLQQGLPSISGIFPATIPPIGGTPPPRNDNVASVIIATAR